MCSLRRFDLNAMKTPSNTFGQRGAWRSLRMAPLLKPARTIFEQLGIVSLSVEKV